MITFDQVVEIEKRRRHIQDLQGRLERQTKTREFGWRNEGGSFIKLDEEFNGPLRETLCKVTVMKIVMELDACAKLGVNVEASKKLLAETLEAIKANGNDITISDSLVA